MQNRNPLGHTLLEMLMNLTEQDVAFTQAHDLGDLSQRFHCVVSRI